MFKSLTSFLSDESSSSPRVLAREESGQLIVEFQTTVTGLLGRKKTHRTVERVRVREPEELSFTGIAGPLALLQDRISLAAEGAGTRVRYESTVGLKGSVFGWLLVMLYVKPVLQRFMRGHLQQLRARVEQLEDDSSG